MKSKKRIFITFCYSLLLLLGSSCGLNPQNADLDLNESLPETKDTLFTKAINSLGMMGEIYGVKELRVMSKDISDTTGSSVATNAEIPRDVTEMVKSTINAIGGKVLFIPYDPQFMQNTALTGYSDYGDKKLPDIIISGGITEFDRALVTKGDSMDIDISMPKMGGIEFGDNNKSSLSSVTLDFNLIDFKTFAGIPKMQAINSVKLTKSTKEDSIGFTVKSATFGAKGDIKKIQGRHAAVRLIVQLSMIEILGRFQKIPYWRLIPNATRDEIVVEAVLSDFYSMNPAQQIAKAQEHLFMSGYQVDVSGQLDANTQNALQRFASDKKIASPVLNQEMFLSLFENVPIDQATIYRRKTLSSQVAIQNTANFPITNSYQAAQPSRQASGQNATKETGSIQLSTNKSQYHIGDRLTVNFSVNEPLYVRIVAINSQGEIATLFPNPYQSDSYCKPSRNYSIPPSGAKFTLDISGPPGKDKIRAIASHKPIPPDALSFTTNGQFDEGKMSSYSIRAATDYDVGN